MLALDMSFAQTFSTHDLRSTAQDSKREAEQKHKWALGVKETRGRMAGGKLRPRRADEIPFMHKRKYAKGFVASHQQASKVARKHDMREGSSTAALDDNSSATSQSDHDHDEGTTPSPPIADAHHVMYSFDAVRSPSQGSQILNSALAKAVEKFEERETVKLVKNEYELLDSEGESVGLSVPKKSKGKGKQLCEAPVWVPDAEEEDYEFV